MNNQLMESLVLGGFFYEVAFPFSKAREVSLEKVLTRAGKTLNKKALDVASKILDKKGYSYYLEAVGVAEKKFLFYKDILEFEDLRGKYLKVLDSEDLALRIIFAMHGCIVHANKILCHMDELIDSLIPDSISAMEVGYNHWTILNLEEPITKCLMTGICICEQGDAQPYMDGCVISDPTRITRSRRE